MGPRRKLLLQTGSLNFRPPVSRSKSAPRLGSIDEENEEDDEEEETEADDDLDMTLIDEREEEVDLSDIESLCYRNTPLGGSANGDALSIASSSIASSSSAANSSSQYLLFRTYVVNHHSCFSGPPFQPSPLASCSHGAKFTCPELGSIELLEVEAALESVGLDESDSDGGNCFRRQLSMNKEHRSRRSLVLARKRFETSKTQDSSQSSEQGGEDPIAILIATERTVEETSSSCSTSTDDGMGSLGKEQSSCSETVDETSQSISGHFSQQRHSSFPQQKRKALRRKRSESSDTPYRGDEATLSDESGYAEEHTVPKEDAQVRPCARMQVTNL